MVFQGLAGLLRGITWEQSQTEIPGNPVLPDPFTQIYIIFLIGFRIGPPILHKRFHIGLPKMHRRFHIGPHSIFSHQNCTDNESCWPFLIWKKSNKKTCCKYNVTWTVPEMVACEFVSEIHIRIITKSVHAHLCQALITLAMWNGDYNRLISKLLWTIKLLDPLPFSFLFLAIEQTPL